MALPAASVTGPPPGARLSSVTFQSYRQVVGFAQPSERVGTLNYFELAYSKWYLVLPLAVAAVVLAAKRKPLAVAAACAAVFVLLLTNVVREFGIGDVQLVGWLVTFAGLAGMAAAAAPATTVRALLRS